MDNKREIMKIINELKEMGVINARPYLLKRIEKISELIEGPRCEKVSEKEGKKNTGDIKN